MLALEGQLPGAAEEPFSQFYLGAKGSGSPVHVHADAWNALAFGEKRWFLFPPFRNGGSLYSRTPIREWLKSEEPARALQCVQRAGDIMYVPGLWGHAVHNMQDCVGCATEFSAIEALL